jgi:two-component system, OmpR family, sensor histidine kinase PrrB
VDIVFDYQTTDPGNVAGQPSSVNGRVLEPLQACFQEALGHELPNRLVAVGGLAQLLLLEQDQRLDTEGKSYLNRLVVAVRQADELVRALAELGRLLREPGPAVRLDLGEMAREAFAEAKVLFPRRQIEYYLSDHLPALTMPQRPWLHVFSLLFRYLVESTREDQPIRIAIDGQIRGDGVMVCVTDQTTERTETELRPMFEPFTRAAGPPGGVLGLFPLRLLVALWGGQLRVESSPTKGTRFQWFVPGSYRKDEG